MTRYLSYEFYEPSALELEDKRVPLKLSYYTLWFKSGGSWVEPINDPNVGADALQTNGFLFPTKFGYTLIFKRTNSILWIAVAYTYGAILVKCLYGGTKIPYIDNYDYTTDGTAETDGVSLSEGQYVLFYKSGSSEPSLGTNKYAFTDRPPYEGLNGLTYNIELADYDSNLSGSVSIGTNIGADKNVYPFTWIYDTLTTEDIMPVTAINSTIASWARGIKSSSIKPRLIPVGIKGVVRTFGLLDRSGKYAVFLCHNMHFHEAMNIYFGDGCYGYASPTWFGTRTAYKLIMGDEADGKIFFGEVAKYPALRDSPDGVWMAQGKSWAKILFDTDNNLIDCTRAFWLEPLNKDNKATHQSGESYGFSQMTHVDTTIFSRDVSKRWNGSWNDYTPTSGEWVYTDNYWAYHHEYSASGLGTVKITSQVKTFIMGDRTAFTPHHAVWAGGSPSLDIVACGAKEIDLAYGDILQGYKYGLVDRWAVKVVS